MEKKIYLPPVIDIIMLDNEISLALESAPPVGPEEMVELNYPAAFRDINPSC